MSQVKVENACIWSSSAVMQFWDLYSLNHVTKKLWSDWFYLLTFHKKLKLISYPNYPVYKLFWLIMYILQIVSRNVANLGNNGIRKWTCDESLTIPSKNVVYSQWLRNKCQTAVTWSSVHYFCCKIWCVVLLHVGWF